jgi:hypothetical protein
LIAGLIRDLPARRDFRWVSRRSAEVKDWLAAVRGLGSCVAVSHHSILAKQAGAECFFSDLILEFRGLEVPSGVACAIKQGQFDCLILCDDPSRSTTGDWSSMICEYYVPAGRLAFSNISGLLPDRIFVKRAVPAAGRDIEATASRAAP